MLVLQPDIDLTLAEAERLLAAWLGHPTTCRRIQRLKGGMVNTVLRLEFDRPPYAAVVKLHGSRGASFAREARALQHLRERTACPVPIPSLTGDAGEVIPYAFLLPEVVPGTCLHQLELPPRDRADLEQQLARRPVDGRRIMGALGGARVRRQRPPSGPRQWRDRCAAR